MSSSTTTRVGHTKADSTDVYVGRGPNGVALGDVEIGDRGWLGNPYTLEEYDREESVERFRQHFSDRLMVDREFRDAVANLSGKTLGCWCQRLEEDSPECHGEVIAAYADVLAAGRGETA